MTHDVARRRSRRSCAPTRARELELAYLVLVREQSFARGRDASVQPPKNAHRRIERTSTGLAEANRVYFDAQLRLAWSRPLEIRR